MRHIADQIVFRDYKLIAQSDFVVVFYDALVPSPGVLWIQASIWTLLVGIGGYVYFWRGEKGYGRG